MFIGLPYPSVVENSLVIRRTICVQIFEVADTTVTGLFSQPMLQPSRVAIKCLKEYNKVKSIRVVRS